MQFFCCLTPLQLFFGTHASLLAAYRDTSDDSVYLFADLIDTLKSIMLLLTASLIDDFLILARSSTRIFLSKCGHIFWVVLDQFEARMWFSE
jgi:hypothetical protein